MSSRSPESRLAQGVLIGATLGTCWLAMQIVHEAGHVVGAWASGGEVVQVVLHPLRISRTDLSANPAPLLVAWAGPLFGSVIPCALWGIVGRAAARIAYLFRFFAGFCLVANGGYLGAGMLIPAGDAGDILQAGGAQWALGLFGLAAVSVGLACWHGLGGEFGLGTGAKQVNRRHSVWMLAAFLVLVIGELLWSW